MNKCLKALAIVGFAATTLWGASEPGITFVGRGEIAGNLADKSGLAGKICRISDAADCIPNTTLGGLGSALTYTGFDNVFLAVPDRGPFDGRTDIPYFDRFNFLKLILDTTKNPNTGVLNITPTLLDTRLLNAGNQALLGSSSAFDAANPAASLRFDPEGVVVTPAGTFIISDEYGPSIYEFNTAGTLVRRIPVPIKFLIDHPTGDVNMPGDSLELYKFPFSANGKDYGNNSGRQANRGMEGLAITPDGRYLVGLMQNALIQDSALTYDTPQKFDTSPARAGLNNRIFKYDLQTGQSWEFVYVMDAINQGKGTNEILAINDHQFLVLERDNRSLVSPGASAFSPASSGLKRIYKIDLNKPGLTDVSTYASINPPPSPLTTVTKDLFLDVLNPAYEVNAAHASIKSVIAEKIEGMAWGPDLPNGHHLLYVISDNDLNTTFPTQIYAFEVDPAGANITLTHQNTPSPMFHADDLVTGVSPFTPQRTDFSGFAGMQLAVGANPLRVTALGRMCVAGNSKTHTVKLVSANTKLDLPGGAASVNMAGCTPGQFVNSSLASPVTLTPLAHYNLVSDELSGGDKWLDLGPVTIAPGASVVGAVYFNGVNWIVAGAPGTSYVPPTLQFDVLPPSPAAAFVLTFNLDNRALRNNFAGFIGMRLSTGPAALNVTSVGRACVPGNSQTHIVKFVNASTGADVPGASASVNMTGCATDFVYTDLAAPVALPANTSYYLVSQETSGGDKWFDQSQLTTMPDATVLSSIYSLNSAYATNEAYASYVVPNFLYTK